MKKKSINALIGTFEKVARATAGRHDIEVIPSSSCSTDGRRIYFPSNADKLAEGSREVMAGWLDHEIGHVAEEDEHRKAGKRTPLEYMNEIAKSKKERALMNIYEDIRMEVKKARELVGVADNLKAAQICSVRHADKRINAHGFSDFWYALGCGIVTTAHGISPDWLPSEYLPYLEAIKDEIEDSTDLTKTRWASDAWDLVQRTLAKIDEVAEAMREESDKRNGDDESEGSGSDDIAEDNADGEGDEDDEGGTDAGEDDAAHGSDIGDTGGTEAGEGDTEDSDAEGADSGNDCDGMSDEDVEAAAALADQVDQDATSDDLMDEVIGELNVEAEDKRKKSGEYSAHPDALKQDRWITPRANEKGYQEAKQLMAKQIRGMKGKLLNLIRAEAEATMISDRDEGDLDVDALHTVKTGNRRVFTQTVNGQTLDTAVSILIDQSGSMGGGYETPGTSRDGTPYTGSKAFYAKVMTIALAETFNALGVPCEVIGFHNRFSFVAGCCRNDGRGTDRCQSYEFQVYKGFDEKYRKAAPRFGSITGHEDNADGEAVLETAKRLAVRRETRKIMFVLSDGLPLAQSVDISLLQKHLKDTVKMITDAGIEVIGIGAKTDAVVRFYNDETGASNMVVNDIDKLAAQVYKVMKERLLNREGKKGRAA